MTHGTWPDGADVLARVGRHWGWMMAFEIMEITPAVRARSARRRIEDRALDPV
jgi:hypothetical protein